MDLNEAETFVRVVETGGMTPAARLLGVPRSTVSRRIARLEADLGVQLLKRTTRRVNLTDEGRALFHRLQPALASAREAAAVVRDLADEPRGVLRVSALADFALWVLAPWVAEFSAKHPELRIEVDIDNRTVDLVGEGYDCSLRAGPMPDSSLIARKLATFDFAVYGSAAYLKEMGTPQIPADLAHHRCVLFRADGGVTRWPLEGPEGTVRVEVRGAIVTSDFGFVQRAVGAGAGLGYMPTFLGDPSSAFPLVRVLPSYRWPGATIRFVTPAGRYVPAKVTAFRDFLVEKMSGERAAGRA